MTEHECNFQLSDLEAWILETIDNPGWYAYLRFPVVYREVLNFGPDGSDEEVYCACFAKVHCRWRRRNGVIFLSGSRTLVLSV
jgi:hypothetical protein